MNSEHLTLAPSAGWPSFARSAELDAFISDHLTTVGAGGIWHYYGFTSRDCVWSSPTSPPNDLYLSFADYPRADSPQQPVELVVVLSNDQSEHYKQLSAILDRLINDFGLRPDSPSSDIGNA